MAASDVFVGQYGITLDVANTNLKAKKKRDKWKHFYQEQPALTMLPMVLSERRHTPQHYNNAYSKFWNSNSFLNTRPATTAYKS